MTLLNRKHHSPKAIFAGAALLLAPLARSSELYDLDFNGSDLGAYQIVSGNPSVQSVVGPFSDALVFHATAVGDQILLPLAAGGTHFDLGYDVLMHNLSGSDYAFALRLDGTGIRGLNFHGGLEGVQAYQASPFVNQIVSSFVNDTVYHVGVSIDLPSDAWSVAIDGIPAFAHPLNGASISGVRFGLAPWVSGAANAPGVFAALDNVVLAVPEPRPITFAMAGLLIWSGCARMRR